MHYWGKVLNEVANKGNKEHAFLFTNQGRLNTSDDFQWQEEQPIRVKEKRDLRTYYLGDAYPGVYFTKREAESLFWMMHGLTIAETGAQMCLSHRTIEFYVKNMKAKLGCASKKRLIEKVAETDLMAQLEADGLRIVVH